mmetsp:Transcript_15177/g.23096  ORF Transcript_15177/g.23096 Transcript_15177/m.23096 type:complete len:94 (+) Transcript_15177:1134-1415(+)
MERFCQPIGMKFRRPITRNKDEHQRAWNGKMPTERPFLLRIRTNYRSRSNFSQNTRVREMLEFCSYKYRVNLDYEHLTTTQLTSSSLPPSPSS